MQINLTDDVSVMTVQVPTGPQVFTVAVPGVQGPPGLIRISNTITGLPGTNASVTSTLAGDGFNELVFTIPRGADGVGVSAGGAAGAVLQKTTGADYDTSWVDTTNLTIANTIVKRDSAGNFNVNLTPPVAGAPASKAYADSLGTSGNTGNTIARRDANGNISFVRTYSTATPPVDPTELTRKDYVDAQVATRIPAFADPNADRLLGWDDSAGAWVPITLNSQFVWSAANAITIRSANETRDGLLELADAAETTAGIDATRAVHPVALKVELDKKATLLHTHSVSDLTATGTKDATTFLRGDGTWAVPPGAGGGGTVTVANITDATAIGRTVLTSADAAAVRTNIGAGTSSLAIGTTGTTAKAGNYAPTASNISDSTTVGRSVLTAVDAPAARTAIGAGTSSLVIGTTGTTAAAGNHSHTAAGISDSTTVGRSVLTAASAAAARTAIGAGTGNGNVIGTGITSITSITQAAYDALGTKDSNTLYAIVG